MTLAPMMAVAASLCLACVALLRPPRRLRQVTFAAGMVAFAIESFLIYGLLTYPVTPEAQSWWMGALRSVSLLTPIPWCLFAFLSGRNADARIPVGWRVAFGLGSGALVAGAAGPVVRPSAGVSA